MSAALDFMRAWAEGKGTDPYEILGDRAVSAVKRLDRMQSGPFHGQSFRDLVREAIEWWEHEISDMEQQASYLAGGAPGRAR